MKEIVQAFLLQSRAADAHANNRCEYCEGQNRIFKLCAINVRFKEYDTHHVRSADLNIPTSATWLRNGFRLRPEGGHPQHRKNLYGLLGRV